MRTDTIPRGDAEFDAWLKNFTNYINGKTQGNNPEWKHIPKEWLSRLNKATDDWSKAYAPCLKPHTKVETQVKNTTRASTEKDARLCKKLFIDFTQEVTDADRRAMGVPIRDKPRSQGTVPDTIAEIKADTSTMRQVTFRYKNSSTASRGKPQGVHGLEFHWALLDRAPAGIEELTGLLFYTASPFTLEFTEAERGKKLYYCGRWESNTGKKGPWGSIDMVVIP